MVNFYEKVNLLLEPYLGESAKQFLDRQIKYHLSKDPEDIDINDKEELAKWCRISSCLFLDKQEMSEEIYHKIISLR
jgi:hypothetical protein